MKSDKMLDETNKNILIYSIFVINKNKIIIIVYKDRRRYKWKRLDILIIQQLQRLMKTY